ncbi:hypothetical protein EJ04DRAFT_469935 [Polyplosphaeria fusca]|uniref:Chromo domain-containing protein n=1 Tax=Polyplosphaeria fusca TaxID=682080 RepID=A0A9P4QRM8_9PLEO|nr:hypothetical protein EJ04DRAFT_469935 [Polyplosphaeria fusca]
MPPALSDEENEESSGPEEIIPARAKGKTPVEVEPEDDDDEEGSDEEVAEGEYVVEKILSHRTDSGETIYEVKWLGYEKVQDRTWEFEDNLTGAMDVLREYWEAIGGKPEVKSRKRKGRKSAAESESTPAQIKRVKKEKEWSPPPGSWELDVDHVDTVEESVDNTTGKLARFAYLVWSNQKKTQHPLNHVYQKCPQKMLQYYESHLVFTHPELDLNGETKLEDDMMDDE